LTLLRASGRPKAASPGRTSTMKDYAWLRSPWMDTWTRKKLRLNFRKITFWTSSIPNPSICPSALPASQISKEPGKRKNEAMNFCLRIATSGTQATTATSAYSPPAP